MSLELTPVYARLIAILCQGRGAAGELGADATPRAIPAGYFRHTRGPLDDPATPAAIFDRGLHVRWTSNRDGLGPNSSRYTMEDQVYGFDLCVGYLVGDAQTLAVHKITVTESATDAVQLARQRALSDARRMKRALAFTELTTGVLDAAGTAIIDVRQEGDVRFESTGAGRLICVQPFAVEAWVSDTDALTP